ncbi:unnamed protein product, partial [Ectocarpus sp. 12 AP-2014]
MSTPPSWLCSNRPSKVALGGVPSLRLSTVLQEEEHVTQTMIRFRKALSLHKTVPTALLSAPALFLPWRNRALNFSLAAVVSNVLTQASSGFPDNTYLSKHQPPFSFWVNLYLFLLKLHGRSHFRCVPASVLIRSLISDGLM